MGRADIFCVSEVDHASTREHAMDEMETITYEEWKTSMLRFALNGVAATKSYPTDFKHFVLKRQAELQVEDGYASDTALAIAMREFGCEV